MCIIAVYQNGLRPDVEPIARMMRKNPDGVGIAWNTGRAVFFKKGFKTVESVMSLFNRLDFARDVVFHARIATSGGISAEKCHPFPMSGCDENLNRTTYAGKKPIIFHNGVFSLTPDDGLNDSQTFIKKSLYPLFKADERGFTAGKYNDLINMAVHGSRLVIMYPDGLYAYGAGWQKDDNGVWYSNSGYKDFSAYYSTRWDDEWEYDRTTAKKAQKKREVAIYGAEWWEAQKARQNAKKLAEAGANGEK